MPISNRVPFLNVSTTRVIVRLIGPPHFLWTHYKIELRRTIPHLVNETCPNCPGETRYVGYAPAQQLLTVEGKQLLFERILFIPKESVSIFRAPGLIGRELHLIKKRDGNRSLVVIEKNLDGFSKMPLPECFDLEAMLEEYWLGPQTYTMKPPPRKEEPGADPPLTIPFPQATDRQAPPARRLAEGGGA